MEGVNLIYIVNTFVNVTMYPQYNNILNKSTTKDKVLFPYYTKVAKNPIKW
jgi:hypothetical protein